MLMHSLHQRQKLVGENKAAQVDQSQFLWFPSGISVAIVARCVVT